MAPKRIYLQWHGDSDPAEIGEPDETGVTWSRFREFEGDVRYTRTDLYMEAIARAEAAEKRLAELEAADRWRPVTDEEPECDLLVELLVVGFRDDTNRWYYPEDDTPIRGYRPLTPPPTAADSIEFWVDDNDEWHVESPANAG